ncbi:MAG: glycosyltransferase [Salinivirgaceae bacterium]|jgi:glycosyltransferase involved in cell wall biosynthesis|nr:glycosyltransferase [Salinivirgaceae bacterium]
MQKICHLTSVHPPFDIRIFHKQCISLKNAGYKVCLVAPIASNQVRNGIEVISNNLPKNRLGRMLAVTFKMTKMALKTKAVIFHFHDPELMLSGILLKLSGKKVIFDVHENVRLSISSKDWLPNCLKPFVRQIYFFVERFSILFFDALVLAEDSYLKYYPQLKSTVVLNLPILIDNISATRNFEKPHSFVYTGGVSENRGVWEMIKLVEKLNQHNVVCALKIVGQIFSDNLKSEIIKYINKHGLTEQIELVGKIEFTQIQSYLENADIGLVFLKPVANYLESLPTKMFEYMQFGLPIILCNFPLYENYINKTRAGICINIEKIDDEIPKIVEFLENTEELQSMSKNGLQSVSLKYNWISEEQKLVSLYQKLLN